MTAAHDYVVPARYLLATVHIRNPDIPAQREPSWDARIRAGQPTSLTPASHDGHTICGQPMLCEHQWVPFTPDMRADRICGECQGRAAGFVEEEMF